MASRRMFIISLLSFAFLFTASMVTAAESDELSNDVADLEAVADQNSSSEKIASDSSPPTEEDTDVALSGDKKNDTPSLGELFEIGVESYLNEDWESCIDDFEKAIQSYKEYKKSVIDCRRRCRTESNEAEPIFPNDVDDLQFYDKKIKETLCLMKCKKIVRMKENEKQLPADVEIKYIERKPYEYLHICYYQTKRHQDAANAVFTFLAVHQKHEQNLQNLRFYVNLPDVVEDNVVDLETEPFLNNYKAGIMAYNDENHLEVIDQLEKSLRGYMKAEDDCRLYCEGPFNQGWLPDFSMSIANHFTYVLKCKRRCANILKSVNGEFLHDLVVNHYHYLQFAYFHVGKLKEACAAVESFLLFSPSDETVLQNKKYFMGLPEVKREFFEPRKEALAYLKRQEYEIRILLYITEEFKSILNPKK